MSRDVTTHQGTGIAALAERLADLRSGAAARIVGLTGSVAAGKTTLARNVADALSPPLSVETVSTDGFLFPNAVLEPQGLLMRKGFPETYDRDGFESALLQVRQGAAAFPAHSHETYDIDPARTCSSSKASASSRPPGPSARPASRTCWSISMPQKPILNTGMSNASSDSGMLREPTHPHSMPSGFT